MSLSRRGLMLGGAAAALLCGADLRAMGRVPVGGQVTLRIPWSTRRIDPHDLFDPLAALFAPAIADTVYERDRNGRLYPTLADGMPRVEDGQTVVHLREGLRSGKGKAMGGRDLAWSVTRARNMGAAGLLAPLPTFVRSDPKRPLIARFGEIDPDKLAIMLSSPLCALLPVGFSATSPDGTGAFRASVSAGQLLLERNDNAARGASFLERVVVRSAKDTADSLREFEAGRDDVGWLGLGLHRDRAKARKFNYGDVGWVVLVTGKRAGPFGAPGVAQQLANGVPMERMHLGLSARPGVRSGSSWHGAAGELLFDGAHPALGPIAEGVTAKLSQKGHELTPKAVALTQLRKLRTNGDFVLALDVVRHPHGGPTGPYVALATADRLALGRTLGKKPPQLRYDQPVNYLTTTLRLGVLGGLGVQGGVIPSVLLAPDKIGAGIDWGASYRGS